VSSSNQVPDPEVPAKARSRTYSAAYKARVLGEYDGLDKAGKGALLRREGLYTSLISAWRQQRDRAALAALAKPAGRPPAMRDTTASGPFDSSIPQGSHSQQPQSRSQNPVEQRRRIGDDHGETVSIAPDPRRYRVARLRARATNPSSGRYQPGAAG
jgi:hypothetical protein